MTAWTGHSVLVVPVPELEPFVRGRWEHYEPSWVSSDPAFTHAHLTILAPFVTAPTADDLAEVAAIAAETTPIDYVLGEVREFPDGCLHVPPEPSAPFAALTQAIWSAFPHCPPYAGIYGVDPHVTLDQRSEAVTAASTGELLADALPARGRADRLELHWYEPGNCHVMADWKLGGGGVDGGSADVVGR
ncbi:2'-5' RNA ligase family protein [Nocardioides humilatus]|uniref:2'-5' RNA ligase family protein n=1 Tax=Nocardioides humilatus TaxID=2607660 RepID=A0A5B1LAT9_9ACTN|nr:2'-5' RNA ligase family protein [Nocardioides humilatus]KAA1416799.1 2'-5' RNA ligase family protein [Nocardioides humilatus]